MNRIVRLAAVAALLSLTLFAVGCGSKTDDAGSTATPGAGATGAAPKTEAATTTTEGTDKAQSGAASGSSPVLPPPANAVKK